MDICSWCQSADINHKALVFRVVLGLLSLSLPSNPVVKSNTLSTCTSFGFKIDSLTFFLSLYRSFQLHPSSSILLKATNGGQTGLSLPNVSPIVSPSVSSFSYFFPPISSCLSPSTLREVPIACCVSIIYLSYSSIPLSLHPLMQLVSCCTSTNSLIPPCCQVYTRLSILALTLSVYSLLSAAGFVVRLLSVLPSLPLCTQ